MERKLSFKVDSQIKEPLFYGKRSFGALKNRNSKEFTIKGFIIDTSSPLPPLKAYKERTSRRSPINLEVSSSTHPDSTVARLETIRKTINLKIFDNNQSSMPKIPPPVQGLPSPMYSQPPIKKVSPQKFIDSITYTKADLNVPSKFIPTDRNTNIFLTNNNNKPMFSQPMYTKKSPKYQSTFPIFG